MCASRDRCTSMEFAKLSALNLFGQLQGSSSVAEILECTRIIAKKAGVNGPGPLRDCYPSVKSLLRSVWAAQHWLTAIDAKIATSICQNAIPPQHKVLVIGGGPCGLRFAIEAQLLGATVSVVEKRDWFSRNNALYLWPFVVTDLKSLGIKTFSKGFGAQQINLISVRQLQHSLLKIALLLGVELHPKVEVKGITEPQNGANGWRVKVFPGNHPVAHVDFHAIIGACGKPSDLNARPLQEKSVIRSESHPLGGVGFGWRRINPKAKRAIGITANFIRNRKCPATARAKQQHYVREEDESNLLHLRNVETHFYYPCDTHYLIMCVSVDCLLRQGILYQKKPENERLLSKRNVDVEKLKGFTKEFAKIVIKDTGDLKFAKDCRNKEDVAIFDFTWSWRAEPSSWIIERRGKRLFVGLVGDSLIDPYWPSGSGTTKGFLGAFDTCWIMRKLFIEKDTNPIQLLAEREAMYGQLKRIQKQDDMRKLKEYTVDPASRYYLESRKQPTIRDILACTKFFDSDIDHVTRGTWVKPMAKIKYPLQAVNKANKQIVLNWCNERLHSYGIVVSDLRMSWQDGFALCGILHSLSADLVNIESLSDADGAHNNQKAINILAVLGIQPTINGQELSANNTKEIEFLHYLLEVITLIGKEKNQTSYIWNSEREIDIDIQKTSKVRDSNLDEEGKMDINQNAISPDNSIRIFAKENVKGSGKASPHRATEKTNLPVKHSQHGSKGRKGNDRLNDPDPNALHVTVSQSVTEDVPIQSIYHFPSTPTPQSLNEKANSQCCNPNEEFPAEQRFWRSTSEPALPFRSADIPNICRKMTEIDNVALVMEGKCHYYNRKLDKHDDENGADWIETRKMCDDKQQRREEEDIIVQSKVRDALHLGCQIAADRSWTSFGKIVNKFTNKIQQGIQKVTTVSGSSSPIVAYDAYFSSDAEDEPDTLQEHEWSTINFGIGDIDD